MAVTNTSDELLLLEIAEHPCVILKYHHDDCGEPCNKLVPVYNKLSKDERYKDIVFLRINGTNNPVAKRYILEKKAPVVTTYYNGLLIDSVSVNSEEEMVKLLNNLVNIRNKKLHQ